MVVTATYSDDSTAVVTDYTYSPSGALATTDTEVVVSYDGKSASVSVTVEAAPEPEPTPDESYVDNTNNIELDITNDETTGTSSFVLDNNGTEISGTAYASAPQSAGVTEAYFLQYEVNNAPKFALAEITESGGVQTITITDDKAIYNNVILPNNDEAYIPLEPTEHKGSYELTIEEVSSASSYNILFDSTAQHLSELTIPVGVPVTIEMGDYGFVNSVNYPQGTKAQFDANVSISSNSTQLTTVVCGWEQSEEIFNYLFWETSKYTMLTTEGNPFTRVDATISDVNKLSGTWTYDDSESEIFTLTYLDTTTDEFEITYDEDDNQVVTHVDANA